MGAVSPFLETLDNTGCLHENGRKSAFFFLVKNKHYVKNAGVRVPRAIIHNLRANTLTRAILSRIFVLDVPVCQSYELVWYSYVTRMYPYVLVCYSCVPYVTRMSPVWCISHDRHVQD